MRLAMWSVQASAPAAVAVSVGEWQQFHLCTNREVHPTPIQATQAPSCRSVRVRDNPQAHEGMAVYTLGTTTSCVFMSGRVRLDHRP